MSASVLPCHGLVSAWLVSVAGLTDLRELACVSLQDRLRHSQLGTEASAKGEMIMRKLNLNLNAG